MDDFLKIVTHTRRFKSSLKEIGIEQLKEIKAKLQKIIDDRIAEEEAAKRENADKLEKIQKYKELLAKDGIDPNELLEETLEKKNKKVPRKPKYEIWTDAGEHITWTGQGRMPNAFKARIESGEALDTFLIDK